MDAKKSNGKKTNANGHGHSASGGAAKSAAGNGANLVGENAWRVKVGLAEMLKGGVIMDVTNAEQAKIAEKAGACAVMALERVPSDIRKEGGVARMARQDYSRNHGHRLDSRDGQGPHRPLRRSRILEALGVDYIDESEVLTPADEEHHI